MKLKNDMQVRVFLIRNKIPFEKCEMFLTIHEANISDEVMNQLIPYFVIEHGRIKKQLPPPNNEKSITRENGNYSNTQWNEL